MMKTMKTSTKVYNQKHLKGLLHLKCLDLRGSKFKRGSNI